MTGAATEGPSASRLPDGSIVCSCGDLLADHVEGDTVVIDGMEFRFRRGNDHMTCRRCGASHPMRQFRRDPAVSDTGERRRRTDDQS